jgi:hypothetical protein
MRSSLAPGCDIEEAVFLAADLARKVDPTLAERYHRLVIAEGRHHVSAVCTLGAVLVTRIAACWRRGERYVVRDVDGTEITEAEAARSAPGATRCRRRSGRPPARRHRPDAEKVGRVGAVRSRPRPLRRPTRPPLTLLQPLVLLDR